MCASVVCSVLCPLKCLLLGHTNQLSAVGGAVVDLFLQFFSIATVLLAIGEWLELDVSSCVSSCRYLLSNLQSLLHPEPEGRSVVRDFL